MQKNYSIACIALRKALLANGYIPLPLKGKAPQFKGWTRQHVTDEWLDSYARKTKYSNTGLRCDNLIAFDIDITDIDLAIAIEALIEDHAGPTELCRYGKFPKRLLLYRAKGDVAKSARTGRYGGHMVEMLATRGRQFVVCGIHPETEQPYQWAADDITPLEIPYNDLPALTADKALTVLDEVENYLRATDLPLETKPRRLGIEHPDLYDMSDDTDCQLVDGTELKWKALRDTLDTTGVMGNLKRENGEFGDSGGVHFYLSDIDGQPVAYDFARDTFHREAPATNQLAAVLPPPAPKQQFATGFLQDMLDNYVLTSEGNGMVRMIDKPFDAFRLSAMKVMMAHHSVTVQTARGSKQIPVVQAWLNHPNALRAHKAALRPDHPDEILINDGKMTVFNTYRRPVWPNSGGEIDTFFEFMDHLLPDNQAYNLVMGWLAYKYAHPGERMHGLLLVSPAAGTGRGTLSKIMGRLFGHEYVRQTDLHDLISNTGQAAYNDDLADALIVYVPEALEYKDNVTQYYQRRGAYENLKQIIDPLAATVKIKRKYGSNTMERTFASVYISSNHIDALAIDESDRRLIVLDNTRTPLEKAPNRLMFRIHDWMADQANIGALARYLAEYAATENTYNPFAAAPMTTAKVRMIDAGQSDIDQLYESYVLDAAGDICTENQIMRYIEQRAREDDLEIPENTNSLKKVIQALLRNRAHRMHPTKPRYQIRINNARVRPWIIRHVEQWQGVTDSGRIKAELSKNGPVTLALVANLPVRKRERDEN